MIEDGGRIQFVMCLGSQVCAAPCCQLIVAALSLRALVPHVGLELDELPGDLVRGALREDAEDGPPGLVKLQPPPQRQPAGARTLATS